MDEDVVGALRLRAVEPGDIDFIFEMENRGFSEGWTDRCAPVSRHSIETYVLACDPDPFSCGQLRLVCTTSGGTPIALLDFYDISARHRHAKVGIMVADGERGKGYGRRLLKCASAFASGRLGLAGLVAMIAEENSISRRLFESAGYALSGRLEKWWHTPAGVSDCLLFQKLLS
ncbi:MAG: GNAT family N-acetyltransferase [Bacteroides sp.]|nr:GNAT family N-acetyltransferase [Bacteroides sp.]